MNITKDCRNFDGLLVAPLQCFARGDLALVGGKAANLGELIQTGFPVPAGFVATTSAYDRFVESNHLSELIIQELGEAQGNAAVIRAAFVNAQIPKDVERAILEAYHKLGVRAVAVRSSATAEDLPEAAFAGQQDTYLNIKGDHPLLEAVRLCWSSLWTDRAIAYRQRQALDQHGVKLAVIVQCMSVAVFAGVLFTANPVTGERDKIVIDASPGLGEAVVSGLVTPDHFDLQKRRRGWRISQRQKGRHEIIIRPRANGGTDQVESLAIANYQMLPDKVLYRLARLGSTIQNHFGSPQDIEWAWDGREVNILQARPITALPEPSPRPSRPMQTLAGMFAEMFPIRPYPLDITTWIPAISKAAVEPIFSLIGIKVPALAQLFEIEDGTVIQMKRDLPVHLTPKILLAPARLLWLSLRYDPLHWHADPLLVEAQSRAFSLEARNLADLSWQGLLGILEEALSLAVPLAGEIRRRYYPRAMISAGLLWLALKLLGHGSHLGVLLSGTESITLQANLALEKLATSIRSNSSLAGTFSRHAAGEMVSALEQEPSGQIFLKELTEFLDRYGHREVVLSTVLQPTWKDDPGIVLGMLKGLAQSEPDQKTNRPVWKETLDELLAHPLLKPEFMQSAFINLFKQARSFFKIREDTHFEATRILPILRRTLLEMGNRLTEAGALDAPAEIFYTELDELAGLGDQLPPSQQTIAQLRIAIQRRKSRRAQLESTPLVDPQLFGQLEPGGDVLLQGTSGSPGLAQGPARIIHNASEFGNLHSGDVLVAPYTNPAWTPLFQRAVAVVVDGGAIGSHAAIVAREYGLPAVMGTVTGTQKLHDGEWIQIDGDHGVVKRASPPSSGDKQ